MIARLILAALLGAGLAAPALAGAGPSAPAGPEEGARANVHVSSFRLPNDINEQTRAIEEAFAPPEAEQLDGGSRGPMRLVVLRDAAWSR